MVDYMITTMDNPCNPFTDFKQWRMWDEDRLGHYTCGWLAILAKTSIDLDDDTYDDDVDAAANELLSLNPHGVHIRVRRDDADKLIALANAAYYDSTPTSNN